MSARAVRTALLCACALLLQHVSAEIHGQCPGDPSPCPARASPCNSDEQCGKDQICCNTSCGQACLDPLYSGCENIRISTERISRALAVENTRTSRGKFNKIRSPRCRADGEFEEIQCDNEIVSSCWCVDPTGFEIAGTRAPAASLVNCSKTAPCAAHTCRMLCPLGFELDSKGCPLCKCRDPCSSITCPGQLSCQLEEMPCLKAPCPPVPTCKRGRSLNNICPAGEPLLISETSRPFLCGTDPGKPNCPPLYKCLVEIGNDYGVCCPASIELQKAGTCPDSTAPDTDCGTPCAHDLECPSMQKCCDGGECGKHCILPHNVTMCTQQKMLAELLVISEKEGRGYVPQCKEDGTFLSKQCSRNELVCWCVDSEGNKLRGSMGPAATVKCSTNTVPARVSARSLGSSCTKALCAGVCEYGYKTGSDGCPTCECDDPCAGFPCGKDEECVRVKDGDCTGELCTGYPVCRRRLSFENPCEEGTPATDDMGLLVSCLANQDCPTKHFCNNVKAGYRSVCCPMTTTADNNNNTIIEENDTIDTCADPEIESLCGLNSTTSCENGACGAGLYCCITNNCGEICIDPEKIRLQSDPITDKNVDIPTMCEYLRDFDEKMEGTVDGMRLALPAPTCDEDGSFNPLQCDGSQCWCVDSFGTEIPDTRSNNSSGINCLQVRTELSCLEMTCRMGCDYGFELGPNRCPTCKCREPCTAVECPDGRSCAVVDVACDADYCPPVPACLPKKQGQCPYLVPSNGACEFTCRSDSECDLTERCCATGCGTACTKTIYQTPCQQRKALAIHDAAESGNPPAASWVPKCKEDGSYEEIQCRTSDRACWCVDSSGNEIAGTRAINATPTCNVPSTCPELICDKDISCEHGRVLDMYGCNTCECRNPCNEAKCKPDEKCEMINLACDGNDCAPMARCTPSPACPIGEPLQLPDGSGPLVCGPSAASCPSSHACRFAPHDSGQPVCCPKPRAVCFEPKEEGLCKGKIAINTTRWFFSHERNRCEKFRYQGCAGNHNNFRTKEECISVCPVLSPCERLREKNELIGQKYGKGTFLPQCSMTGAWEPVQCMSHIDVCWCVSALGEPLKGSLVRGSKPNCNFRQARKWTRRDPLDEKARADEVLEELIRQMTTYHVEEHEEHEQHEESDESLSREDASKENILTAVTKVESKTDIEKFKNKNLEVLKLEKTENVTKSPEVTTKQKDQKKFVFKTKCQLMKEEQENGLDGIRPRCLSDGSFSPRQCSRGRCWCVDAAGHRRSHVGIVNDLPEPDPCELTQIDSATLELELINVNMSVAERSKTILANRLALIGARVPVSLTRDREVSKIKIVLNGPKAADIIYHIENWVKQEKLSNVKGNASSLSADVIRSEYRLAAPALAMQRREIFTESTVSATTSYHTALIVLAATSAFVISVLCVLVMLYRGRLQREPHKAERFLPPAPPVYVLSADEKAELAKVLHPAPPPPVPPQSCDDIRL